LTRYKFSLVAALACRAYMPGSTTTRISINLVHVASCRTRHFSYRAFTRRHHRNWQF